MMRSRDTTALITDAERSQDEQLRIRQFRYIAMMCVRIVLLLVAAVLVMTNAPLLWLWLPACAVGMVVLPWIAVLVANDRLPKTEHRIFRRHQPASGATPPELLDSHSGVVDVDSRDQNTT